jgi:predicted dehydrogenase
VPRIEIYGAEATLSVPDPNTFGGPVEIKRAGANEWEAIPIARPYEQNSRGIAVADMARALRSGGSHRADGRLAYHVLDIMHAFHDASAAGRHVAIKSTCERPEPLPQGLEPGRLEA